VRACARAAQRAPAAAAADVRVAAVAAALAAAAAVGGYGRQLARGVGHVRERQRSQPQRVIQRSGGLGSRRTNLALLCLSSKTLTFSQRQMTLLVSFLNVERTQVNTDMVFIHFEL